MSPEETYARAELIRAEASAQLARELFIEQVQVEVTRMRHRYRRRQSLWQRLIDKLPFTIVWREETP